MKLLYVENHDTFARVVSNEFLDEDEITVAKTIEVAWNYFTENNYDVVLVDYDLDDGKGDELVKKIRQTKSMVKIIAVSSHEYGNNQLLKAGADAICSKMDFKNINEIINAE